MITRYGSRARPSLVRGDIHQITRPQVWNQTRGRKTYVHQAKPANADRTTISSSLMGVSESSFDYPPTNERRCAFQSRIKYTSTGSQPSSQNKRPGVSAPGQVRMSRKQDERRIGRRHRRPTDHTTLGKRGKFPDCTVGQAAAPDGHCEGTERAVRNRGRPEF